MIVCTWSLAFVKIKKQLLALIISEILTFLHEGPSCRKMLKCNNHHSFSVLHSIIKKGHVKLNVIYMFPRNPEPPH